MKFNLRSLGIFFNSCFTVWPFCFSSLLSFFKLFLYGACVVVSVFS